MAYNFEEIKHFYLRKYLVEFNNIVINTPQDDFTQFLNSLKKSKDYIVINALLKTIQILDKPNLQKSDIEESRSLILKENPSMKDKTTKVIVNNLNCALSNKIPKLFKSHNTNVKKAYIKNTFTKLKSTINQLLNKEIMKLFNVSLKEYNSALIKCNFEDELYQFETKIFNENDDFENLKNLDLTVISNYEKLEKQNKEYHHFLFDTKNCTYLALDEIVTDSKNGNYLKYFYKALFNSFKYILLSNLLIIKNKETPLLYEDIKNKKLSKQLKIQYDIANTLVIKNLGKTRTSLYMINIAHYLYLKPYSAFDFSNHYLGKGNSSKIKKNISFKDIENSFYDLQFTLFPNYQLYNHTKDPHILANDQFYKQALKMLLDMILEDAHKFAPYNNQTEIISESELNRKSEAYHFITRVLKDKIIKTSFDKLKQNNSLLWDIDNSELSKILQLNYQNITQEYYNTLFDEIQKHDNSEYLINILQKETINIHRIISSTLFQEAHLSLKENTQR